MMAKYTQDKRQMSITTPLGKDELLLDSFSGFEAMSYPFEVTASTLSQSDDPRDFDKLLGQNVTITMQLEDDKKDSEVKQRYFNGIVTKLTEGPKVRGSLDETTLIRYRLVIMPKLVLLEGRQNSRIFQLMTVPDIITAILGEHGITNTPSTTATYEPRNYCVQYRETDFAFISRLMEEEGIWYYFKHTVSDHEMVWGDDSSTAPVLPEGPDKIVYRRPDEDTAGGEKFRDRILIWKKHQEIRPKTYTLWDHHHQKTGDNQEQQTTLPGTATVGEITHKLTGIGNDALEVYDYPGSFAKRFDGIDPGGGEQAAELGKIPTAGTGKVKIHMEVSSCPGVTVEGEGAVRQLISGHKITLDQHFDANGDYLILQVVHEASIEGAYSSSYGAAALRYTNAFEAIPLTVPFRAQKRTVPARVPGMQTATVVGPSGEEIFTDKYGRVKVQFQWDREGQKDQNSSCWLRVATLWSGRQWGTMFIPRIGQEVLVDFIEGDPDRPIIVGCVYNDQQMPPYILPDNKTVSGIKTNSTLGGVGFNEIRFEDKKDSEQIFMHAQKDKDEIVVNDSREHILHDRFLTVGKEAGAGDQHEKVWNNKHLIVKADHVEHIEGNVQQLYGEGDQSDGGNIDRIQQNNLTDQIKGDVQRLIGPTGGNFHQVIKTNRYENVNGELNHTTDGDRKEKIGGGYHIDVGSDLNVATGANHSLDVGAAYNVKTGADYSLDVGGSFNHKSGLNIGMEAGANVYIKGLNVVVEGDIAVTLKVGGNFVNVSQAGVAIKGNVILINSGGAAGSGSSPSCTAPTAPTAPTDATEAAPQQAEPTTPIDANIKTSAGTAAASGFESSEGKGGGTTDDTDEYTTKYPGGNE
ncbi:Type VI secretion system tip protein VgrG [Planctomycetales bacterium 10988]|nr:Type VI secretion system tip protein VgrG [Planctomycetales bacterium 10988]